MIERFIHKLKTVNPWHFLWIGILASIIFSLILNTIQSYLWWGFLSRDLLLIGVIDGFFVPLLVAPIIIYFVLHTAKLEELNKALQIEIVKVKQSEEKALMESEALYRAVVEDQTEFINRFLPDGTVLFVNEAACGVLQKNRNEVIGSNFISLLPVEDQKKLKQLLSSLTPENPVASIEHRIIAPDGEIYYQHWTNRALFDRDGKLVQYQAVGRDVTKMKQTEEALRESEARLRKLSDNLPNGLVYQIDTGEDGQQRRFSYISAGVEHLHGITVTEVLNNAMSIYEQIISEDRLRLDEEEAAAVATMAPFFSEARLRLPSGEIRWRLFASAPRRLPNNHLVWDGVEIDITERKRAEKALIESREWFRKLVETMNEGLGIQDQRGVITYVNARFCQMVGHSADELIGKQLADFLDETNKGILEEHIASRKKGDKTPYDLRWTKKTGEFIYTVISPQPLFDESGQYKGSFATLTDITDRKQLEKSLKESEHRFRITLLNSPIVVFNQDRNLRFTWIYNPHHGYSQDDVIGKTDADFFEIESIARLTEIKRSVIETGISRREEVSMKLAGELLYYDSTFEPLRDPEGNIMGITCVAIDITKRKQDEELIRSYQEQLSLLASRLSLVEEKERRRIAKDLHDNIGQILACAKLKLGELNKSFHVDCRPAVGQIYELVDQSIRYTRSLTAELSVPILYEMGLQPAVAWLGREFQKNHAVQFHLRDDGTNKPLNEDVQIVLFKAVRELLTNVGKHAHAKNITVSLARKDGSMQITVEDDGVGFDVEDTRKGTRIQTCFGLFSTREALKNCAGSLDIDSAPGRATRITLTAPLKIPPS